MNAHYSMSFITFYLYIFSELQFYISFNILLDNEVMETSKRRSFLPLVFIILRCNVLVIVTVIFIKKYLTSSFSSFKKRHTCNVSLLKYSIKTVFLPKRHLVLFCLFKLKGAVSQGFCCFRSILG